MASLVAVEISIIVKFAVNEYWTFTRSEGGSVLLRLFQFNVGSFGSVIVSLAAVNILTPLLGVSYLVTNSLGIMLGLAGNWFWSRHLVWREPMPAPHQSLAVIIDEG